jgi:hypothetical protein
MLRWPKKRSAHKTVHRLGVDYVPDQHKSSRQGNVLQVQLKRAHVAKTRIKYAVKKLGAIRLGKIYYASIRPAVT